MKSSRRLYGQIHAYIDSTSDVLKLFHVLRQNKLCLYFVLYMLTRSKKIQVLLISNSTSYNTSTAITLVAKDGVYLSIFVAKSRPSDFVYLPVLVT